MKFRYKKFSSSILRPVIQIVIKYKSIAVKYEVLIDSGADICIFDAEIADALGIVLKSGEKQKVSGITGKSEAYYLHDVVLSVGGNEHKTKVGFLENYNNQTYGVVGQKGFFNKYSIKFELNKEQIELKESLNPRLN